MKRSSGNDAIAQLRWNISSFNKTVKRYLSDLAPDLSKADRQRMLLLPRLELDPQSSDAQVVLKLTSPERIREAKCEAASLVDGRIRGVESNWRLPITAIFDEDDLNTQSVSRDTKQPEKEL